MKKSEPRTANSSAKLSDATIVTATQDNLSSGLGEEAVILNMANGRYYGLNTTAAFIWDLIQRPISVGEIQSKMCEEFEVDQHQCRRDLEDVLERMLANGLIEVR